jgi:DNA (cytosine-5)-methyltransferase 1
MPATDLCHPTYDRPLSIQEYTRIQEFPDHWALQGTLMEQYRQVGNAVPVGLGRAIGRSILAHRAGTPECPPAGFSYSRYANCASGEWEDFFISQSRKRLQKFTGHCF